MQSNITHTQHVGARLNCIEPSPEISIPCSFSTELERSFSVRPCRITGISGLKTPQREEKNGFAQKGTSSFSVLPC